MNSLIKKALSVKKKETKKKVEVTKDVIELVEYHFKGNINTKQVAFALGCNESAVPSRTRAIIQQGVATGVIELKY